MKKFNQKTKKFFLTSCAVLALGFHSYDAQAHSSVYFMEPYNPVTQATTLANAFVQNQFFNTEWHLENMGEAGPAGELLSGVLSGDFSEMFDDIMEDFASEVEDMADDMLGSVLDAIPDLELSAIEDLFGDLENLTEIMDMENLSSLITEGVSEKLSETLQGIEELPQELISQIQEMPDELISQIQDLQDIPQDMISQIQDMPDELISQIQDLPSNFEDLQNMPQELASQIQDMPDELISQIQQLPDDAISQIKELQNIPQDVISQIQETPQGVIDQIKNFQGDIEDFQNMPQDFADDFRESLEGSVDNILSESGFEDFVSADILKDMAQSGEFSPEELSDIVFDKFNMDETIGSLESLGIDPSSIGLPTGANDLMSAIISEEGLDGLMEDVQNNLDDKIQELKDAGMDIPQELADQLQEGVTGSIQDQLSNSEIFQNLEGISGMIGDISSLQEGYEDALGDLTSQFGPDALDIPGMEEALMGDLLGDINFGEDFAQDLDLDVPGFDGMFDDLYDSAYKDFLGGNNELFGGAGDLINQSLGFGSGFDIGGELGSSLGGSLGGAIGSALGGGSRSGSDLATPPIVTENAAGAVESGEFTPAYNAHIELQEELLKSDILYKTAKTNEATMIKFGDGYSGLTAIAQQMEMEINYMDPTGKTMLDMGNDQVSKEKTIVETQTSIISSSDITEIRLQEIRGLMYSYINLGIVADEFRITIDQ